MTYSRQLCVFLCALPMLRLLGGVEILPQSVFSVGEHGFWRVCFKDGACVSDMDFRTNGIPGGILREESEGKGCQWSYESPDVRVSVRRSSAGGGSVDYQATVELLSDRVATGFDFPARLRFDRKSVRRFSYPARSNWSLGLAFNWKFFNEREPKHGWWMSYRESKYPAQFADFARLETADGRSAAVYGLQPRPADKAWENPHPFNPATTAVGSDGKGGWYDHQFALYLKKGEAWVSPKVRIALGGTLQGALADYSVGNGFVRTLAEKVGNQEKLERLKRAPLYKSEVNAANAIRMLERLPVPTLYHFTTYLKGGFDKEYPDHFPVNRKLFGTEEDLRRVISVAHEKGHLICPYTNPTWWCDHPKGPTFMEKGEGALLVNMDGTHRHETYSKGKVDGWQVTCRHPDAQEANRRTLDRFVRDFPVDFVFQDQVGARDWIYDLNPAANGATDMPESYIAMNEEDSAHAALMTEDGWDRIAENNVALCGCNWWIFPFGQSHGGKRNYKEKFPADTWEIEPISLYLFHDKCLFYSHDLAGFVKTPALLAWTLGCGYQISYENRRYEKDEAERNWYEWLHLLQRLVVSRIAGQRLVRFRHDRTEFIRRGGDLTRDADDGTICARYGDVEVSVNLGDVERTVNGRRLAPYGWWITAPGLVSGNVPDANPFVESDGDRYEFCPSKLKQTKERNKR